MGKENLKVRGSANHKPSKIDSLLGKHTKDFIILFLASADLLCLIFGHASEQINSVLQNAFLLLIGYFTGTKAK